MHQALAFTSFLLTSFASAQGVTSKIAPNGTAPAGCLPTYSGTFAVEQMNITGNNNARRYITSFENFGLIDTSDEHGPVVPVKSKIPAIEGKLAAPSVVASSNCVKTGPDVLNLTLKDTVLSDSHNRTGYIASNRQWQFDGPPQAGAISTAGYTVCANSTLALGSTTVWWFCGSGSFSNIYDSNWAPQCIPQHLVAKKIC